MGSIGSPGISNLAQILAIAGPPAGLAEAMASAAAPSGVTGDSVHLSDQALQLLDSPGLFAGGASASPAGLVTSFQAPILPSFTSSAGANSFPPSLDSLTSPLDSLTSPLNSLTPSLGSSLLTPANSLSSSPLDSWTTWDNSQQTGSSSSSSSSSSADQSSTPASLLAQDMQALFGGGAAAAPGSSINLLA